MGKKRLPIPGRLRFFLGGAGQSPQTGIVAPPPYRDPSPAPRSGGRPAASFRGESVWALEVVNRLTIVIEYEPCHGVCALLQADGRRAGTSRCAGSILTSCSCCESSSWSPSRRTAGLSPERRLLCARANRECATKRGARTAAIEPADVVAPTSGCRALFYCPDCRKPVLFSTLH